METRDDDLWSSEQWILVVAVYTDGFFPDSPKNASE